MGRKILAVVVALITAWGIILVGKMVATRIGATPNNLEYMSRDEVIAYFSSRPVEVYVTLLIVSIIGAFFGGYIVTNMSRRESPGMSLSLIIGAILIVGGVLNFFVLLPGQPSWLIASTLILYMPVTLIGHKMSTA